MKKKRIKQKEDKKTDRKHGNRTRKAILGILSVLVLLCLNSCGRELEEREFPDTLVIRDSALPFEKSLQTEQDKSSKYLDYGQVRCVLREDDLTNVKNDLPGLYRRHVEPGQEVHRGEVLASIIDPLEGEVISQILSPTDGIVFFAYHEPTVMEGTIIFKIIRRLHE